MSGIAAAGRSAGVDTTAAAEVHRQTVKKEEKSFKVQEKFAVTDPIKMQNAMLTRKPTEVSPTPEITAEQDAATRMALDMLSNRKQVALTPPERFELPQSSNQEYGFVSKPLVPKSELLEVGRTNCAETQYASDYYALTGGMTPFSRKDRGTPSGEAKK